MAMAEDWADEGARKIWDDARDQDSFELRKSIAAALRKVREDTLKEAARKARGEWSPQSNVHSPEYILRHQIAEDIERLG